MNRIYLDWNATAPLLPDVRDAYVRALDQFGNASSIHQEGQSARSTVERARRAVAKAISAPPQSVVLTGGATESNNQVIRHHVAVTDDPFVVCSAVEHPSVIEVVEALGRDGVRTAMLDVDGEGRIDLEQARSLAAEGATLFSVMLANNEIGNVYPVADIAAIAHEHGALLHTDGTQALGRIPLNFEGLGVDYLTLSFHKSGGPKGIGAIAVREGLKVEAILHGGHQERGRRPGTENVPAAAALEAHARLVAAETTTWHERMIELRKVFWGGIGSVGATLRGDPKSRLPNTLNIAFDGVNGEDLLLALDLEGIAASSGSACTAGSLEPSHVVLAMGFDHDEAKRSVRFSFGPLTSPESLDDAAARITDAVRRLQQL